MTNPLLDDWNGPFGLAPFERISDTDFEPALDVALERHTTEMQLIADNPEPASFANVIEALEAAGRDLAKVLSVFFTVSLLKAPLRTKGHFVNTFCITELESR